MNRESIFEGFPTGDAWHELRPWNQRDWAVELINRFLLQLEAEGREPDAWEAADVGAAIGFIASSFYSASAVLLARATTPLHERSHLIVSSPIVANIHGLRDGLVAVAKMPVAGRN